MEGADGEVLLSVERAQHQFPPLGRRASRWRTRIAHKGAVAGAKAFAAAVVECFSNPAVVEEAKRTFKEELGGVEYKSMLPPDQKPPVELNRAMMEKFRPEMAQALSEGAAGVS